MYFIIILHKLHTAKGDINFMEKNIKKILGDDYVYMLSVDRQHGTYSEVIDDRPITYNRGNVDNALFTDLNTREQEKVWLWVQNNIFTADKINFDQNSYGLKHLLERDTGVYMTNNQFKDTLLEYGVEPVEDSALNWIYCIKKIKPSKEGICV